jgi:uncharacterized membrane protein YozB (DUF420 family)
MSTRKSDFVPPLHIFTPWGAAIVSLLLASLGLVILGIPQDWYEQSGFLGTNASLMSDLSLVAYIFIILPTLLAGYVFARNKQFVPYHQVAMTFVMALNWSFILFVMAASLQNSLQADTDEGLRYQIFPLIHALVGLSGQILGTYLVIRMWFEEGIPEQFKVKDIKFYMRITLGLWLAAALLGIITYAWWNTDALADNTLEPLPTPEATQEVEATPEALEPSDDSTPSPEATPEAEATPAPEATEE